MGSIMNEHMLTHTHTENTTNLKYATIYTLLQLFRLSVARQLILTMAVRF